MDYFETSAKLNQNVDEVIGHMMELVYKRMFYNDTKNGGLSNGAETGRETNTVVINRSMNKSKEVKKAAGGCC
jgi:hypothetical protein